MFNHEKRLTRLEASLDALKKSSAVRSDDIYEVRWNLRHLSESTAGVYLDKVGQPDTQVEVSLREAVQMLIDLLGVEYVPSSIQPAEVQFTSRKGKKKGV